MADEGARARTHEPVMVEEVVEFLGGRDTVIDMTLGAGGHAEALLRSGCKRVVGIDRDPEADFASVVGFPIFKTSSVRSDLKTIVGYPLGRM